MKSELLLHSVSYAGLWGQHFLSVDAFIDKAAELGYSGVMLMAKRPHISVLDYGGRPGRIGAALQHNDGAFAAGRRIPARKTQMDPVGGLDAAGHHLFGHRIGGNGNKFHEAGMSRCAVARAPYSA